MIIDDELSSKIESVCADYAGTMDDLYSVVGMIVVGQLFGWKVLRLASSRRHWSKSIKLFGDPKLYMPERGPLSYKSLGLVISDNLGRYWDIVRGVVHTSVVDRKAIL
jgi:hypothetical protein